MGLLRLIFVFISFVATIGFVECDVDPCGNVYDKYAPEGNQFDTVTGCLWTAPPPPSPEPEPEEATDPNTFNADFAICTDTRFVPLNEFASGAAQGYFYATPAIWTENSQNGYWHLGQTAQVVATQKPGTVPIKDYHNGVRHRFTTKPEGVPGETVGVATGSNGYVYTEQIPGTYALMNYRKGNVYRLVMQYNAGVAEDHGYVLDETLGYAYRPCLTFWL